jgi:hypothetical protein
MSKSKILLALAALSGSLLLGACAPTTTPGGWAAAGCYDSPTADVPDLRYSGTPNVAGNLTAAWDLASFTLVTDGSCAGIPLTGQYAFTMVRASSEPLALTTCSSLGQGAAASQMQSEYPLLPADAWVCATPEPAAS